MMHQTDFLAAGSRQTLAAVLEPLTVAPMGPLLFTPFLRPMVWGGRLLGDRLGKRLPDSQLYGESWEISDHDSWSSTVAHGPLTGTSLRDLMIHHRVELLGPGAAKHSAFPWLVKFLDAHDWLSVQVHPSDALVKRWWPGEGGKTEVWFVLDAAAGSRIYAGLLPGVTEQTVRAALAEGKVERCLHHFEPRPGDCVFLPAGTVHAVGGGVLMVEIQQTSDATFRLFDWNRRDADGKSRTLHIEQALACIDWTQGPVEPVPAVPLACAPGARQWLAACQYFDLEIRREAWSFNIGGQDHLQLLIPVEGRGSVQTAEEWRIMEPGQVWVLPASMPTSQCLPDPSMAFLVCALPD